MRKPGLSFVLTILVIFFASTANSRSYSMITVEDLEGNWVTVQRSIVPSEGLDFGGQIVPGGLSIGAVTLWTFDEDGTCSRESFANFDGTGVELTVPLTECIISLSEDGIGEINIESPLAGPSTLNIIVIDKDEIAAISSDSAISAFTFKRQNLKKRQGRR